MAKSSRFATQFGGEGSSVGACKHPFSSPKPEIQEMRKQMRYLNIEVVDDTALIDTSLFPKPNRKIKNPKRPPRKEYWKIKIPNKPTAYSYSRAEMLALSFHNVEDQRNKWSQVYAALAAPVAAEYHGLLAPPRRPNPVFLANFDGGATALGKRSPQKISVH